MVHVGLALGDPCHSQMAIKAYWILWIYWKYKIITQDLAQIHEWKSSNQLTKQIIKIIKHLFIIFIVHIPNQTGWITTNMTTEWCIWCMNTASWSSSKSRWTDPGWPMPFTNCHNIITLYILYILYWIKQTKKRIKQFKHVFLNLFNLFRIFNFFMFYLQMKHGRSPQTVPNKWFDETVPTVIWHKPTKSTNVGVRRRDQICQMDQAMCVLGLALGDPCHSNGTNSSVKIL